MSRIGALGTKTTHTAFDPEGLASCVGCGLCLAHCPTWRVSGEEGMSPRGRIAAMRAVDAGAPCDASFERLMNTCVMCRACETACPSSVPFGHLMEEAREMLAEERPVPVLLRTAYGILRSRRALSALTKVGAIAQRARVLPPRLSRRLALPARLPLHQRPLRPTGQTAGGAGAGGQTAGGAGATDQTAGGAGATGQTAGGAGATGQTAGGAGGQVWLFTGCVMDAWQRNVHRVAIRLIGYCGGGVSLAGGRASCCGALHAHAGLMDEARRLAGRVIGAFPGDAPILVDSAGCGAQLESYGALLGTEAAHRFSARVLDVHEWLAVRAAALPPPASSGERLRIAVHDPCHLRHVQRCEHAVRRVLAPYGDLVEVADDGRCCGAGGAYGVLQPKLAGSIRDQKMVAIAAAGADVVASANPGCTLWLAAAGVRVRHPLEIAAEAAGLRA